jgi:hypothetical protein
MSVHKFEIVWQWFVDVQNGVIITTGTIEIKRDTKSTTLESAKVGLAIVTSDYDAYYGSITARAHILIL